MKLQDPTTTPLGGFNSVPRRREHLPSHELRNHPHRPKTGPNIAAAQRQLATRRVASALIVVVGIGLLAACGGKGEPPPTEADLVEVVVSTVGGPIRASGELEPTSVNVGVFDVSGEVIRFDDENRANHEGDHESLSLPAGTSSLGVLLPAGSEYVFEARAADETGSFVAYGDRKKRVTEEEGQSVAIDLDSLLGEATLTTRLPINSVLPGQELDLLLHVTPRTRPDLLVAATDYRANYEPTNGEAFETSAHGARVRAGQPTAGDLVIRATASGIVLRNNTVEPGSVETTFRLPFTSQLSVDLEAPIVSDLFFDADDRSVQGVATDAVGVVHLEVYDGPVLLASTDLDAVAEEGVPEVVFPGGGTSFVAPLAVPAGDYFLTIFATDFSGNETHEGFVITMP